MLQNLYVKNLALIDETEVEFGEGLNILTGETGAGKSILLGSVTLALGGKYNAQMLRNGAKSGLVELTFYIKEEKILKKLEALDIYPEDGYLTLSRRLLEGRSVSKINGETVNMSVLKDVASLLIDIHGQHDNQTLLHRKNHLTLLDLYGKEQTDPLKEKMASCYQEWKAVCKKVEQSSLDEESRRRELSLAEFEVNEIEEAALKEGEDELLEEQYRKMTDSRKLTEGVAEAYQYTAEDERGNASDYLSRAIRSLQEAASFDEKEIYLAILDTDGEMTDLEGYWKADIDTLYLYLNEDYSDDPTAFDFDRYFTENGEYIQISDVVLSSQGDGSNLETTLEEMMTTTSVIQYVANGTYWIGSDDEMALVFYFEDDEAYIDLLYEDNGEIQIEYIDGIWSLDYDNLYLIDEETGESYVFGWYLTEEGDGYCFELIENGTTYYLYESAADLRDSYQLSYRRSRCGIR